MRQLNELRDNVKTQYEPGDKAHFSVVNWAHTKKTDRYIVVEYFQIIEGRHAQMQTYNCGSDLGLAREVARSGNALLIELGYFDHAKPKDDREEIPH